MQSTQKSFFSKHCIIVRNPASDFKEKVNKMNIPCIGKAIDYDTLTKEHARYEAKRELCKEYDLFFCDYTIYDLLRKPLGKYFYDKKK